ncbi:hypothetical protein CHS0354_034481 [Potamilus streckersoni]|uniref:Dienelactone hydrolase domain-containing protein n=1 Tax=Potamilus streckersoni TaxID=2493646 RepID=A0AAE0T259_9BIVA|nr:hypothetical protein CHS0354_034481 [Potamilus streckersoni]
MVAHVIYRHLQAGRRKFGCLLYSTMSGQKVTFKSENALGDCPGTLDGDVTKTKKGLIVLQEWWGVNVQIQQQASEIGKLGNFVTLVPDLYRGKVAKDNEEAGHYMGNLDWPGAVKDIDGAAKYLKELGCKKVGVTGFCMGGALSLASAALSPNLSAAAPFYGIPEPKLADLTTIKIPLQCHFGSEDTLAGFSSPDDAKKLKDKLSAAGVDITLYMYPNAGHGFTHKGGHNYKEDAATLAQKRLCDFMNEKLS